MSSEAIRTPVRRMLGRRGRSPALATGETRPGRSVVQATRVIDANRHSAAINCNKGGAATSVQGRCRVRTDFASRALVAEVLADSRMDM